MKDFVIYRDENKEITILRCFHEFIKKSFLKNIQLTQVHFKTLLRYAISRLDPSFVIGKRVVSCSKVPVIRKGTTLFMVDEFKDFDYAYEILAEQSIELADKKKMIQDYYNSMNIKFYVDFFDRKLYKTTGALSLSTEKELLIAFFNYDENDIGFI